MLLLMFLLVLMVLSALVKRFGVSRVRNFLKSHCVSILYMILKKNSLINFDILLGSCLVQHYVVCNILKRCMGVYFDARPIGRSKLTVIHRQFGCTSTWTSLDVPVPLIWTHPNIQTRLVCLVC